MPARLATLLDLLHRTPSAALATHSVAMAGHPFASAVAFAPDPRHCPLMLLSGLAEHSRNLQQDGRASLMVSRALGRGEIARATLVGEIRPCAVTPALTARYLRYQPDAARLLALGDFAWCRLEARRIQVIGGFARAGWLEGAVLQGLTFLDAEQEARLLEALAASLPSGWTLLGIDAYGADLAVADGTRERLVFATATLAPDALAQDFAAALRRRLEGA